MDGGIPAEEMGTLMVALGTVEPRRLRGVFATMVARVSGIAAMTLVWFVAPALAPMTEPMDSPIDCWS